jgi:hypothetical protein
MNALGGLGTIRLRPGSFVRGGARPGSARREGETREMAKQFGGRLPSWRAERVIADSPFTGRVNCCSLRAKACWPAPIRIRRSGPDGPAREWSEVRFPHSLGLLYSAFTGWLGFKVNSGEYKVMGMAPYGQPRFLDKLDRVVRVYDDGSIRLNMEYFSFHPSLTETYN